MTRRNYELDYEIASKVDAFSDPRDVRALTEAITVYAGDGEHKFRVESGGSGRTYDVNTRYGKCSCYDHSENNNFCKHLRAVNFIDGQRPITIDALYLGDVAADVIAEDNDVDAEPDDIDTVDTIRLRAGDGLESRTKWVDTDGNLLAESAPAAAAEAAEPEPGADLEAERELVHEQEPDQQAAADGGHDNDAAICGAETADGGRCQRTGSCPYHGDDDAETDETAASSNAGESDADAALAELAADGGAVAVETGDDAAGDVIDRVLERAGEQPIVVVLQR